MKYLLIVGLGNPGDKYSQTRHNVGWMVLDSYLEDLGLSWTKDKNSQISKFSDSGTTIFFIKPQEFMNLSGREVKRFVNMYKISPDEILVVHDEIDFPFGRIKSKVGGGTAGHNGLGDIVERIGSKDFHRLRFGVGKPNQPGPTVADFVLQNFLPEEKKELEQLIPQAKSKMKEWILLKTKS
jgi:PTH1 family peptidyl-tRNA hydrolase